MTQTTSPTLTRNGAYPDGFQFINDECAVLGACGCGFCKRWTECDYGDCRNTAVTNCPVFHYRVCPRHATVNVSNTRIVEPRPTAVCAYANKCGLTGTEDCPDDYKGSENCPTC